MSDSEHDRQEALSQLAFFQWAQAKHKGQLIAGIQTDNEGNGWVVGDASHPDFAESLGHALCAWIDAKGFDSSTIVRFQCLNMSLQNEQVPLNDRRN